MTFRSLADVYAIGMGMYAANRYPDRLWVLLDDRAACAHQMAYWAAQSLGWHDDWKEAPRGCLNW